MRQLILLSFVFLFFSGCKKEMPEPPTETTSNTASWGAGPSSFNTYNITFFTTNGGGGPIQVDCGGQTAYITYYFNFNPGCRDPGCANFEFPPGTYSYSTNGGQHGTITTGVVQCITIQL